MQEKILASKEFKISKFQPEDGTSLDKQCLKQVKQNQGLYSHWELEEIELLITYKAGAVMLMMLPKPRRPVRPPEGSPRHKC
ncbi:hypothetical protein [Mesorhizobium sp.]|uniref:hypothetical protein n=1 Tax=Mesorhizobium sp. TaxID=1871066 RepID=UPI0025F2A6A0|nr:hypothetical protein [Mesorhizobium sp.]